MATERQAPDVLLASTNLSGAVTDIDDDPDSPDLNWMTAVAHNSNSEARTSFPTPTGPPTVGAGLQEFKIQVRKSNATGNNPTARIELWENGSLVRAGSDTTVTSITSQLISFTWNANELGTSDGSLVECRMFGTAQGGSPTNRCSVDYGAVEWNVTYSSTKNLVASAAGAATTAGVMQALRALAATAAGVATASGVMQALRVLTGTSAGTSTAAGVMQALRALTGTSDGVGSATSTMQALRALAASSVGTSTADGVLTIAAGSTKDLVASSAGSSTAGAVLGIAKSLIGTSDGVSTGAGAMQALRALAATAAGGSTADATISPGKNLVGTSSGVSTAGATGQALRALAGISAGVSGADAVGQALRALVALSSGASGASGTLSLGGGPADLIASAAGTSTASGVLTIAGGYNDMDAHALHSAAYAVLNVPAVQALLGAPENIFAGRAPRTACEDYIIFGEMPSIPFITHDSDGGEVTFTISIWTKKQTWQPGNLIQNQIRALMLAGIAVPNYSVMVYEPNVYYVPADSEGLKQIVMEFPIQMLED